MAVFAVAVATWGILENCRTKSLPLPAFSSNTCYLLVLIPLGN
jgi:hypothetical protein